PLPADPAVLVPRPTGWIRPLWAARPPATERPSEQHSRENIRRHYDLSNELFALFLDPTMSYSSALFPTTADGGPDASWPGLAAAQHRKIDRLLDLAQVGPGSSVLEI
ncbi:class I SAM-dependent methyltransferase, partial [Kitasatospora sp. SC0581]|uniref:class I SAM-dependent methyltransferase n=1 Tax=Kitasatospora sp. SC0581 TaxID=3394360 RepID=UPI003A84BE17